MSRTMMVVGALSDLLRGPILAFNSYNLFERLFVQVDQRSWVDLIGFLLCCLALWDELL